MCFVVAFKSASRLMEEDYYGVTKRWNNDQLIYNFSISLCSHIPKAKATTIAETPELRRIAENTKLQSNVKYHADFEKAKGKLTQVRCSR